MTSGGKKQNAKRAPYKGQKKSEYVLNTGMPVDFKSTSVAVHSLTGNQERELQQKRVLTKCFSK